MNAALSRIIFCFLLGACTLVFFAPYHLWFAALPVYAALYGYLQKSSQPQQAFWMGAAFSTGAMITTYHWLISAMGTFASLTRPDLILLAAFFMSAAFWVLFFVSVLLSGLAAVIGSSKRIPPLIRPWVFALFLVIAEACRGMPSDPGSTWGMTGYIAAGYLPLAQLAALGGVYLVGFVLIGTGAALATRSTRKTGAVFFILCLIFGYYRLETAPVSFNAFNKAAVELTQASLSQKLKLSDTAGIVSFQAHYNISSAREETPPNRERPIVIWPETAIPGFYEENEGLRQAVAQLNRQARLVTGFMRRGDTTNTHKNWNQNVIAVIDKNGEVYDSRTKTIGVPFMERVPYRRFLQPVYDRWLPFLAETELSTQSPILKIPALGQALAVNCYESGFPFFIRKHAQKADFILNLANDAWFAGTAAPDHALAVARFRAIENRMTLVRVSNAGTNAVIDPYGRYIALQSPYDQGSLLIKDLPEKVK